MPSLCNPFRINYEPTHPNQYLDSLTENLTHHTGDSKDERISWKLRLFQSCEFLHLVLEIFATHAFFLLVYDVDRKTGGLSYVALLAILWGVFSRICYCWIEVAVSNDDQTLKCYLDYERHIKDTKRMCFCFGIGRGYFKLLYKIMDESLNSSGFILMVVYSPIWAMWWVLLYIEASIGTILFICLIAIGYPVMSFLRWMQLLNYPSWYCKFLVAIRLCCEESIRGKFEVFRNIYTEKGSFHEKIVSILVCSCLLIIFSPFLMHFGLLEIPQFTLRCLLSTPFEEITTVNQLEKVYTSLLLGKEFPLILVKPPSKDQNCCLERVAEEKLDLKRKNLQKLIEAGFSVYAVGCHSSFSWWQQIYRLLSPAENATCSAIFSALKRKTVFISHRWASDGTWHGTHAWQLKEVFGYINTPERQCTFLEPKLMFFWMDGLCVPQEQRETSSSETDGPRVDFSKLTMLVIGKLDVIVQRCGYFFCIDGSSHDMQNASSTVAVKAEDRYLNRSWCLYELYHGKTLHPHFREVRISQADKGFIVSPQKNAEVLINHDFFHRLFLSVATEATDKYHIIRTIFTHNSQSYSPPAITLFSLAQSQIWEKLLSILFRQGYVYRRARFEFVPVDIIVALNIIINFLESFDRGTVGKRTGLLSKETKSLLHSSQCLSHGLGFSRVYTLMDLLHVGCIFHIETSGIDDFELGGQVDVYSEVCRISFGLFGLTAVAHVMVNSSRKISQVQFEYNSDPESEEIFAEKKALMFSQDVLNSKQALLELPWVEFQIVDVEPVLSNAKVHPLIEEKGRANENIIQNISQNCNQKALGESNLGASIEEVAKYQITNTFEVIDDTTAYRLMFPCQLFALVTAWLSTSFWVFFPFVDIKEHIGSMKETSCIIDQRGCYLEQVLITEPKGFLICGVTISLNGENMSALAYQWGSGNSLVEIYPATDTQGYVDMYHPGAVVGCFFSESECALEISDCKNISLNDDFEGSAGAFQIWASGFSVITLLAMLLFLCSCSRFRKK